MRTQALHVVLGDHVRIVGTFEAERIQHCGSALQFTHERIAARTVHQHIVGCEADLPGVGRLGENHLGRDVGEIGAVAHEHGRLAAEFQRDGHQMWGGRLGHAPSDSGRAGEQQMIERQRGKRRRDIGASRDHENFVGAEGCGDEGAKRIGCARRQLGWFDHHAIAGSQHSTERAQREGQGKVPGRDVSDYP